jgi:glycerol-3-phosphate dehydrogenase (NAD(P)+)
MSSLRISVLGGGSFGTSIANVVAKNGYETRLWMRDADKASLAQKKRENTQYLPGYRLDPGLEVTADLEACLSNCDLVLFSVPSSAFRHVAKLAAPYIQPGQMVISCTKGIEKDGFFLMSQVLSQELNGAKIGVLSGPNFAKEMIDGQITGSVLASEHNDLQQLAQKVFSSDSFRIYSNHDCYGVELAGALKNIYAIIIGMASAKGAGKNTEAMLLTRSLTEMGRFARKLGADPMTLLGLAGVGDLVLTCTSNKSRNFRAGYALGQGKSLAEALEEIGQVVEGLSTLKTVYLKSKELDIYMPLVSGLYAVTYENQPLDTVVSRLMSGVMSSDVEFRESTSG